MYLFLPLVLQETDSSYDEETNREDELMTTLSYESLQSYSVTLCASSSFLFISWWQEEEVFKLSSSTRQELRGSLLVFSLRPSFCDVLAVICFVSFSRVFMSEWDINSSLVIKSFPPSFLSFSLVRQSRENNIVVQNCVQFGRKRSND